MLSRLTMGKQASSRLSQLSKHVSASTSASGAGQARTMVGYTRTKFQLNTGADIPAIGFGTWQVSLA